MVVVIKIGKNYCSEQQCCFKTFSSFLFAHDSIYFEDLRRFGWCRRILARGEVSPRLICPEEAYLKRMVALAPELCHHLCESWRGLSFEVTGSFDFLICSLSLAA